jgi:hypothetical protein
MHEFDWWTVIIAAYAAIVATGALGLEIRRWFESGPRLSITVMPQGTMVGLPGEEGSSYLVAIVVNRGNAPTTITHYALFAYGTWLSRLRSKPTWASIVIAGETFSPLPNLLQPGEVWTGMARHNREIENLIDSGNLYVVIYASHTDRPTMKRVRRPAKPPAETQTA